MKWITAVAAAALAVGMAAPAALAREGSYMLVASGTCTATVDGQPADCLGKLTYAHFAGARTSFTMVAGDRAVTFSGLKDEQPDLTHYRLKVDSLVRAQGSTPERAPAAGQCDLLMQPDGKVWTSVTCTAKTASGVVSLNWQGDGTPVSATSLN